MRVWLYAISLDLSILHLLKKKEKCPDLHSLCCQVHTITLLVHQWFIAVVCFIVSLECFLMFVAAPFLFRIFLFFSKVEEII